MEVITFERNRLLIKEIYEFTNRYINYKLNICGWVQFVRKQPPLYFIQLNDGSTIKNIQVVINLKNKKIPQKILSKITRGACIAIQGKLLPSPVNLNEQAFELHVSTLFIMGTSPSNYPINKQAKQIEYLRNFEHLRIRTRLIKSIHRIRNGLAMAIHQYFQKIGCQYIHTPIITSNDCEGAGETFKLTTQYPKNNDLTRIVRKKELFKDAMNLTVSGQLHGESYACGLGDIYTFGPTFRAENSNTSRHLNEFWMIEPELCFINQQELHDLAEDFTKYCLRTVFEKYQDELKFLSDYNKVNLNELLSNTINHPFTRIEYSDAIELLKSSYNNENNEEEIEFGIDLNSDQERFIVEKIFKRPVIIYNYPKKIKSFYMKTNTLYENDPEKATVQAMDLLVPGIGELIGGSIRENNYEKLKQRIKENNVKNLDWYLDLRKYGSAPHGGFGLGFERLVQLCTGMSNIRDVIAYPRYPKHVFA